jgi:hypothetical protein
MGVSSVGKASIAKAIAKQLGWPFEEGDDLHSEAEITKMHNGHPLDDHDCWPWLERVGARGLADAQPGGEHMQHARDGAKADAGACKQGEGLDLAPSDSPLKIGVFISTCGNYFYIFWR